MTNTNITAANETKTSLIANMKNRQDHFNNVIMPLFKQIEQAAFEGKIEIEVDFEPDRVFIDLGYKIIPLEGGLYAINWLKYQKSAIVYNNDFTAEIMHEILNKFKPYRKFMKSFIAACETAADNGQKGYDQFVEFTENFDRKTLVEYLKRAFPNDDFILTEDYVSISW